jgi:hypothetical protein
MEGGGTRVVNAVLLPLYPLPTVHSFLLLYILINGTSKDGGQSVKGLSE